MLSLLFDGLESDFAPKLVVSCQLVLNGMRV